ncbi:ABC transporter permease [Stomatohabitans albus]|uniref:ABC transporter permease n=1 Tax=Stomatohabitans albus TaxID=3110766 RepID=UPI00300C89DD
MILELLVQHLLLSIPAIVLSFVIAIPIGRIAFNYPKIGRVLTNMASLLYTIPALPLLIIIPILFGTSLRSYSTVIIALVVYGVALMARSATDAFGAVDPQLRDTALAMGYSKMRIFWQVDLPLAAPLLLSGLRVVTVSTIALVTIGALVGISSLGSLLTDGFQRGIVVEVLTGTLLTMAIALVLDVLLGSSRGLLLPWTKATPESAGN